MEQCQQHQYIGGNICSKMKKIVSFLNRQCAAMLAAPITGHDVIFTLYDVYSFGAFFHCYTVGKGRPRIGQVSRRTPADSLYCMV